MNLLRVEGMDIALVTVKSVVLTESIYKVVVVDGCGFQSNFHFVELEFV